MSSCRTSKLGCWGAFKRYLWSYLLLTSPAPVSARSIVEEYRAKVHRASSFMQQCQGWGNGLSTKIDLKTEEIAQIRMEISVSYFLLLFYARYAEMRRSSRPPATGSANGFAAKASSSTHHWSLLRRATPSLGLNLLLVLWSLPPPVLVCDVYPLFNIMLNICCRASLHCDEPDAAGPLFTSIGFLRPSGGTFRCPYPCVVPIARP